MKLNLPLVPNLLLAVTAAAVVVLPSPGADEPKPNREAFINEVLDAKPTTVTPKFDDYTPGSYHVKKEDLLQGLTDEATKRKLTLRGVSIVGPLPADPLWTSYVMVFIQEGEKVRVNSLIMPHARITHKATDLITAERYKSCWRGYSPPGSSRRKCRRQPAAETRRPRTRSPPLYYSSPGARMGSRVRCSTGRRTGTRSWRSWSSSTTGS
jgi:hypothetical protein